MKILILKHGAFGDIINATGAFAALRHFYPKAHITLLTHPQYKDLCQRMGFFDQIWTDPRFKNPLKIMELCRKINRENFDWIFDLQNSSRTSLYFWLLSFPKPHWSGIAPGCSHPQRRSDRDFLHFSDRFADQLRLAGVDLPPDKTLLPYMTWLQEKNQKFSLPSSYVLLIPGSSKSNDCKRWPSQYYQEFAQILMNQGVTPVLIGSFEEQDLLSQIHAKVPNCINLSLQTNLPDIGILAKEALATIGNDTGAVHLAAAVKCPTLVLWSNYSSPDIFSPRGSHVKVVYQPDISKLTVSRVHKAFQNLLGKHVYAG